VSSPPEQAPDRHPAPLFPHLALQRQKAVSSRPPRACQFLPGVEPQQGPAGRAAAGLAPLRPKHQGSEVTGVRWPDPIERGSLRSGSSGVVASVGVSRQTARVSKYPPEPGRID
jgi:hypothetical protein